MNERDQIHQDPVEDPIEGEAPKGTADGDSEQRADCEHCPHWTHGRDRAEAECQRNCKRHFWTELLRSVTKIAGIVLAAFGLQRIDPQD